MLSECVAGDFILGRGHILHRLVEQRATRVCGLAAILRRNDGAADGPCDARTGWYVGHHFEATGPPTPRLSRSSRRAKTRELLPHVVADGKSLRI